MKAEPRRCCVCGKQIVQGQYKQLYRWSSLPAHQTCVTAENTKIQRRLRGS